MEKKVSEPLISFFKTLDVPFQQSSKMTLNGITELIKLNLDTFVAEKKLDALKIGEASTKQLQDMRVNGLLPHGFSLNEIASFISGKLNVTNMTEIFMQRIHMITSESTFSEVLSHFDLSMDDYRKLPMNYLFKDIFGMPPMEDHEFLDHITLSDIEFLNPEEMTDQRSFMNLTTLAQNPMLRVLTQTLQALKYKLDQDIVSLINTHLPQFDKLTIFQTLKNALDTKHGAMIDQKHSDQLYEDLVKKGAFYAHSTGTDRLIDALNTIRFSKSY